MGAEFELARDDEDWPGKRFYQRTYGKFSAHVVSDRDHAIHLSDTQFRHLIAIGLSLFPDGREGDFCCIEREHTGDCPCDDMVGF